MLKNLAPIPTVWKVLQEYRETKGFFAKTPSSLRALQPLKEGIKKLEELPPEMPLNYARKNLKEDYFSHTSYKKRLPLASLGLIGMGYLGIASCALFHMIVKPGALPTGLTTDILTTVPPVSSVCSLFLGVLIGLTFTEKAPHYKKAYLTLGSYQRHLRKLERGVTNPQRAQDLS